MSAMLYSKKISKKNSASFSFFLKIRHIWIEGKKHKEEVVNYPDP